MLQVVSMNLNGIRSASRKGFFDWVEKVQPDMLCFQETKAQTADLDSSIWDVDGYQSYFSDAKKKGYSGVGIMTRIPPDEVVTSCMNTIMDEEGRYIALRFQDVWVISLYLPSGTSGEERQNIKYQLMDFFYDEILVKSLDKKMIIAGDWNIAHQEIDLKNWKSNQKNSGFLPEERTWLDKVSSLGWIDAFRNLYPDQKTYTWWTYRAQARSKDVGWRIDYQWVSPSIQPYLKAAKVMKDPVYSDHAPLLVDYTMELG